MEVKRILIIVLMILIVGAFGLYYFQSTNNEVLVVGDAKFKVPNDYKIDGVNADGNPTIKNGSNAIYFTYYNSTNIPSLIKSYVNGQQANNVSVIQSNFTVNNYLVYKTDSSKGASHYWFSYNGKTYSIFTWKDTFNVDNTVIDLISSINSN